MAYITNRDDEEQNPGLGSSGGGAFAGGGGSTQAGVQKGTGGTQPWVNIQNYLKANPADTSGKAILEKDFNDTLNRSIQSTEPGFEAANKQLLSAKSAADSQLGEVDKNINDAKSAYRQSILQAQPNVFGGATQRAIDASKGEFQSPTFSPVGLDSSLNSKVEMLKSPYDYLSAEYAKQGLSSGQRNLQEQLTRKSTAFPQIAQGLLGQYDSARKSIEDRNKAIVDQANSTAADYRQKFSDANQKATGFANQQQLLGSALSDKSQWNVDRTGAPTLSQSGVGANVSLDPFGNAQSLPEVSKLLDQWGSTGTSGQNKAANFYRPKYDQLVQDLLSKYGF